MPTSTSSEAQRTIAWTTWPSWSALSSKIAALVEPAVNTVGVAQIAEKEAAGLVKPAEISGRLLSFVQRSVRFLRGRVADQGLVSRDPTEILRSGTGDSWDQATLLLAMLRSRGLRAELVLAPAVTNALPDVPSIDSFDQPLIVVTGPGLGSGLWLDVVSGERPDDLDEYLRGMNALPVRAGGAGLISLPGSLHPDR